MSEVDLVRMARAVWKWSWLILLGCVLAAAVSYRATELMPRTYLTVATIVVGEQTTNPQVGQEDIAIAQRAARANADLVRREPILSAVIQALDLRRNWWELRNQVLVTHVDGSQIIEIRVEDRDPVVARDIATEITKQLIAQSPTSEIAQQLEKQRKFTEAQISQLQVSIAEAEATIAEQRAAIREATSARAVLDAQDEIQAAELKLTSWRATYATLLNSYQTRKPANAISVLEPAFVPSEPAGPNLRANLMLAVAVSLLLSVTVVLVVEHLDDTIRDLDGLGRALGSIAIAPIVNAAAGQSRKAGLTILTDAYSSAAEAYRVLRSSVQLEAREAGSLSLVVAGVALEDGKSRTSSNLAVSMAQSGRRTILVDADLRNPTVQDVFGLDGQRGLTTLFVEGPASLRVGRQSKLLEEKAQLRTILYSHLQETKIPGLRVMTTGPSLMANPADLLDSEKMGLILDVLKEEADVLVLEAPPLLSVADAAILAARVTGVVLVMICGRTQGRLARLAIETLSHAKVRVLSLVLDRTEPDVAATGRARLGRKAESPFARQTAALNSESS